MPHSPLWVQNSWTVGGLNKAVRFRACDVDQTAHIAGMGKFDAQIGWLYAQKAHAERALADLNSGHRSIEIDGEDETQEWVKTYEHLIAKYQSLILAYKARNE